jgi:hypothetical protein
MAAKNYTINFVDPTKSTLNVLPNAIAGPRGGNRQTDIDLIGMGHSLWGETILENFIHMLENFSSEEDIHVITSIPSSTTFTIDGDVSRAFPAARTFNIWGSTGSPTDDGNYIVQSAVYNGSTETTITVASTGSPLTAPNLTTGAISASAGELGVPNKASQFAATTPIQGQLWYNQTRGQLYVSEITGSPLITNWKRVGGITFSDIAPTAPSDGDLWWETTTYAISTDEYGRNLHMYAGGMWIRVSENYIPRDGSKAMQGDLDMDTSWKVVNLSDPTDLATTLQGNITEPRDAVNVGWADDRYVNITGDTMTGIIDMGTNRIENLADPDSSDDAVNLNYTDINYIRTDGTNNVTGNITFAGSLTIPYGEKIHLTSGTTDPGEIYKYTPAADQSHTRIRLSDNPSSNDKLDVGYESGTVWVSGVTLSSNGNIEAAGSVDIIGSITAHADLYSGANGSGNSHVYLRDNNSAVYRGIRWNDSGNEFQLQDNASTYRTIYHSGNLPSNNSTRTIFMDQSFILSDINYPSINTGYGILHTLNYNAYVPADADFVLLRIRLQSTAITDLRYMYLYLNNRMVAGLGSDDTDQGGVGYAYVISEVWVPRSHVSVNWQYHTHQTAGLYIYIIGYAYNSAG